MNTDTHWLLDQRVRHPDFGHGVITEIRFGGVHSRVRFHNGALIWVRTADLEFLDPVPHEEAVDTRALPGDRICIHQMLEAFKLGIVPDADVPHFTFGRRQQIETIRSVLDQVRSGGSGVLIEGPYGAGKTHMIAYIAHLALQNRFAVMRVELDPFEVTPYKPKRIYRALMRSLRWPLQEGGIGTWDHLWDGFTRGDLALPEDHLYFQKARQVLKSAGASATVATLLKAWLEGELLDRADLSHFRLRRLPVLYDHSTAADHLAYLLSGWAQVFRGLGLAGLVLLFDEGETVFHLAARLERLRGTNTLRGLVDVALNRPYTATVTGLVYDPAARAYTDAHGMVHSGIRPLPYAFRLPSYLGVVVTVTPTTHRWYQEMLAWFPEDHRMVLWPFVTADYERMTRYVVQMFQAVYPECAMPPDEVETLFMLLKKRLWQGSEPPNPRVFLKALSEFLMLRRGDPQTPVRELLEEPRPPHLYRIR